VSINILNPIFKLKMKTKRTIAIGDIHGCAKTLIKLLEKLDNDQEDTVIF
jgi:hypothetical protein